MSNRYYKRWTVARSAVAVAQEFAYAPYGDEDEYPWVTLAHPVNSKECPVVATWHTTRAHARDECRDLNA